MAIRIQQYFSSLLLLSTFLGAFFSTHSSQANEGFQFDRSQISLRGSGCPQGTYSTTFTDDLSTMTILFDQFSAEVPQFDGNNENDDTVDEEGEAKESKKNKFLQRRVCTIRLAALVPPGKKLTSLQIDADYRGSVILEPGTVARYRSVMVSRGGIIKKNKKKRRTVVEQRKWVAKKKEVEDDFVVDISKTIKIPSKCAKKKERRANLVLKNVITAKVKKKARNKERSALISLDSADVVGKMKFKFNLKTCGKPS